MALADTATDVRAVYAAWDAAFNKGDAKAVAAFYTDDAIVLPPSQFKGRADVKNFVSGLFEIGLTSHKAELIEVTVDGADTIAAVAKWSVKHKGESEGGLVTSIFTKQRDRTLKIKLHMFSLSPRSSPKQRAPALSPSSASTALYISSRSPKFGITISPWKP
jgi:uncharacterized protein (TIGR02246 family)